MSAVQSAGEVRRLTVTAGALDYEELGDGPPIVFLHPLLASSLHWRKVMPLVAGAGFRCIAPTLPLGAHATPMRPGVDLGPPAVGEMVAEVLATLDLGPVTLVGNDSGGAIAQILTAARPDVVERLVLTNCDAFEHFFPPLFRYLTWGARIPGFAATMGQSLRIRALRHTPLTFGWLAKHRVPHDVIDAYCAPFLREAGVRADVVGFLRGVDKRDTCQAAERLRSFDKPVLLAWAREDRVFAPALAQRLAALLPQPTLRWIDDSYAFTPEDQPAVLADHIIGFLRHAPHEP